MPTGYTAPIEDTPGYTFPEFLWSCLRAFDIACRDSAGPVQLERQPDIDYYVKILARDRMALGELLDATNAQLEAKIEEEHAVALAQHEACLTKGREERRRYDAMKAQVTAWMPPEGSDNLGKNLKAFMLDQIRISLPFDETLVPAPVKLSVSEYRKKRSEDLLRNIHYNQEHIDRQTASAKRMNAWLEAIHESVPRPAT